jgi:hypothetical protein
MVSVNRNMVVIEGLIHTTGISVWGAMNEPERLNEKRE